MEILTVKSPKPFVSFVVATLQNVNLVSELIFTAQYLKDFPCEFCVSDGGSTDGTLMALELESLDNVRIIRSGPDFGIYDAWNFAIPACRGEYLSFIGIDDRPQLSFLKAAKDLFDQGKSPAIYYGDATFKNGAQSIVVRSPSRSLLFEGSTACFDIPHPGSLNHRSLFDGQEFDSSFCLAGDLEFYLRMRPAIKEQGYGYLPLIQVVIEANGVSRNPKSIPKYLSEFTRIEKMHKIKINYSFLKLYFLSILGCFPWLYKKIRTNIWIARDKFNL